VALMLQALRQPQVLQQQAAIRPSISAVVSTPAVLDRPLANNDILDPQTQEKLTSQIAVRPDQSFIGSWSKAPCDSTSKENLRLTINSRRIKTSDGAVCEFHDFASDPPGWRLRATCSQGKERWKADGKFTLRNKKLIWASEGDVSSYFRCK
jgi:hypothetical protein